MFTFFKWVFMLLLAVLGWLVGLYTMEYFRPYKKIAISKYK